MICQNFSQSGLKLLYPFSVRYLVSPVKTSVIHNLDGCISVFEKTICLLSGAHDIASAPSEFPRSFVFPVFTGCECFQKKRVEKKLKNRLRSQKEQKKKQKYLLRKKSKMRENLQTSFNVDEYKNKLLSKIVVERNKLEKNKKVDIEEINIPSLHSSSLKLKNVKFLTDIPTWYISLLKSRIEENWKFKNIIGELSTLISFRIYRSGKITNLKIEKSSGYAPYDRSAVLAVKSTKDIPPFPEEIKQSYFDVIIEFKKED